MRNNCRKALMAIALTILVVSSAFADDGIMHTGIAPPPSTGSNAINPSEADGIIWSEVADPLTDVGLSLLQSLTRI